MNLIFMVKTQLAIQIQQIKYIPDNGIGFGFGREYHVRIAVFFDRVKSVTLKTRL